MVPGNPGQELKLSGIRRYCSARGWEVAVVARPDFSSKTLPGLLGERRPDGCIVEGISNDDVPPPRLFGTVPVVYLECPPEIVGDAPNILVDDDAIAHEAVRELSAGQPSCYAVVGAIAAHWWSVRRIRAFRGAVFAETGRPCHVFPILQSPKPEPYDDHVARLSKWVAALPRNSAIFAVSDLIAVRVAKAARATLRIIPKELTLISVDNHPEICETADPPITSIQLDFERMGYVAAKALGEKIGFRKLARQLNREATFGPLSGHLSGRAALKGGDGPAAASIGPLLAVRRKSTGGRGRHEPWVMEAAAAIRAEACEGLSASKLIARYPVSKRLFTMRFREATGHSVLDEILHVRLEKAYTLLSQTDTAIGAIPALCGFRSGRTLEALFRNRTGLSMRDWRKRNSR